MINQQGRVLEEHEVAQLLVNALCVVLKGGDSVALCLSLSLLFAWSLHLERGPGQISLLCFQKFME